MRVMLALGLGYLLSIFYRSFLSVIAGPLSVDLGIGAVELGMLGSVWFAAFALCQFPTGYGLDILGPRRTVTIGLAIATGASVLLALSPGYAVALVAMALLGAGLAPVFMAALYLFSRTAHPSRFAPLASIFVAFGSIGNLAGAAPLAMLSEAHGWRVALLIVSAFSVVATALAWLLTRDPPVLIAADGAPSGVWRGLAEIVSIRPLWLLAPLTMVSYAMLAAARGLWVAPYLGEVHGFDAAARGNGALVMALAMAVGVLLYGALDRWSGRTKSLVAAGNLLMALAFAALAAAGHGSPGLAVALFGLVGLAGFNYALLMSHARLFFPSHLTGRGMTSMNFLFIAGAALVQAGSGWLIGAGQAQGLDATQNFATLHWAFAGMLVLAVMVYLAAPSRPDLHRMAPST